MGRIIAIAIKREALEKQQLRSTYQPHSQVWDRKYWLLIWILRET